MGELSGHILPTVMQRLESCRVILASNSPRRRELLSLLHIDFEVEVPCDVDESYPADLPAEEVAPYVAKLKADAMARMLGVESDTVVITADTVVIDPQGAVLGKPHSAEEAIAMLERLSGATHRVVTGIVVMCGGRMLRRAVVTEVEFATLTAEEINYYVANFRPLDKAGAYGVQEWIGAVGVKRIDGSYYNVMGLPVHVLYSMLGEICC